MTLFPWPQDDAGTPATRPDVWWKRTDRAGRGLLIDSPAVPLRLAPESPPGQPASTAPKPGAGAPTHLLITA